MPAELLADWFTSPLNIILVLLFFVLMVWHGHVLWELYRAGQEMDGILIEDRHASAVKSQKYKPQDRLLEDDWMEFYPPLMTRFEPYLHNHYDILPLYTLTGLLGTVLSIAFSYDLETQAQLGIALLSTGMGVSLSMLFRTLGTFIVRNRERYLSHYRQIENARQLSGEGGNPA